MGGRRCRRRIRKSGGWMAGNLQHFPASLLAWQLKPSTFKFQPPEYMGHGDHIVDHDKNRYGQGRPHSVLRQRRRARRASTTWICCDQSCGYDLTVLAISHRGGDGMNCVLAVFGLNGQQRACRLVRTLWADPSLRDGRRS